MKSLAEQMSFYHQYHKKRITKLTHLIGIPLAILPVLMLFNWVDIYINGVVHVPLSWLAIAILMAYYFFLDWQLAKALGLLPSSIIHKSTETLNTFSIRPLPIIGKVLAVELITTSAVKISSLI